MAEVLPCPSFSPMMMNRDHENIDSGTLCLQPSTYPGPEPNPPFIFPLEPEKIDAAESRQEPSSREQGPRKHSVNRSKPQRLSINPLPPFEFHSSTSDGSSPRTGSPTRSPRNRTSFPTHTGGHRRNGSEFIGGDGRSGGQGLQSTSPTKGEGTLPTPPSARTPPLGHRPRHAHRRSGAISSHDVSTIIKPANEGRGSSAPTTPSMASAPSEFQSRSERLRTMAASAAPRDHSSTPPNHRGTISFEGLPRPRVGFSDTIEFIPRPLSTISSETSSSLSTIRPGHSVTGSITSIVSAGTSSPPSTKGTRPALNPMMEVVPQPRPQTANPLLSRPKQDLPGGETTALPKRPSSYSAAEHTNTISQSVTTSEGLSDEDKPHDSTSSIVRSSPDGAEENRPPIHFGLWEPSEPQTLRRSPASSTSSRLTRPRTSPERKVAKKQRKVKSWAGSILSRKAGRREIEDEITSQRSLTPPPPKLALLDDFCLDDINFDEDTTCVIQTPLDPVLNLPRASTHISTWKPRNSSPASESDGSASILDLDTVLGALDATDTGVDMDDSVSKGFSIARRRMHSSGATGGFSGPGMHYHRRADSLPEMAAINYHAFGFPSLSSNAAMADVFEEEEDDDRHTVKNEEDVLVQQGTASESGLADGLDVQMVDTATTETTPCLNKEIKRSDGGYQPPPVPRIGHEPSNGSLRSEAVVEDFGAVEIVNADEEPRAFIATKASKSATSPIFPIDPFLPRPVSAPIDFAMRRSGLAFATPESSCVSSPDFNRTSFDTPRMHTANSSITDRVTLGSCRTGETGLSIRGSVDDVPSLTSSASMVSARGSRFSRNRGMRSEADHSFPLPAEPVSASQSNAGKRSSLASLSRLVGSSYGEKSKLHIEEHVQPDIIEKTDKKKGNRISRLMRFWKSKEKLSST